MQLLQLGFLCEKPLNADLQGAMEHEWEKMQPVPASLGLQWVGPVHSWAALPSEASGVSQTFANLQT